MDLLAVVNRVPPVPWEGDEKIPWHEPGFSARMLPEHLSQTHDRASRRLDTIGDQVAWIHDNVLSGTPGRVLDLACGPGLYAQRFARRGHRCVGIDFSPASIAYARAEAEREGLRCEYEERDLREGSFGTDFSLVTLIAGELNTFRRDDAARILRGARDALRPGGRLVLEVHRFDFIRTMGTQPAIWFTAPSGLFGDTPHICLRESAWSDAERASVERYHIIDAATGRVDRMISTTAAYTDAEYRELLGGAGFTSIEFLPSLTGAEGESDDGVFALLAESPT